MSSAEYQFQEQSKNVEMLALWVAKEFFEGQATDDLSLKKKKDFLRRVARLKKACDSAEALLK